MPSKLAPSFELMDASILALMGEACTYLPQTGGSSAVTAAITERSFEDVRANGMTRIVQYDVLVTRDDISKPQVGDGFKREDSDDLFSYVGIFEDKGPNGIVYRFERHIPLERGGNRLP